MAAVMGEVTALLEVAEGLVEEMEEKGEGDLIANATTIHINIP